MDRNQLVIDFYKGYPTDGTHTYHWVDGFDGVTRDLFYQNDRVAESESQKRTFCCGLTFEVFLLIAISSNINLVSSQRVKQIKNDWFVATGGRKGPVDALVRRGLATEEKQGKHGDFAQIWRKKGSGHSVIVIEHTPEYLKYWSTQPSTNGIGIRTEFFKEGSNPITEIYIARLK